MAGGFSRMFGGALDRLVDRPLRDRHARIDLQLLGCRLQHDLSRLLGSPDDGIAHPVRAPAGK